ncbi:MAG: hypothetical protein ACYSUI_05765 [Planctomycetota bacterium]|jgi:hypothetical protein
MQRSTLSSVLRSNQAYSELLSDKQTLPWGIAFYSQAWPTLADANQLREVVVPDPQQVAEAFEAAEGFFAEQGLRCRRWTPAADQPVEALSEFLQGKGHTPRQKVVMALTGWPDLAPRPDLRILPARAMKADSRWGGLVCSRSETSAASRMCTWSPASVAAVWAAL